MDSRNLDALHRISSKKHLAKYKYLPAPITAGFWSYKTQPTNFNLLIDNFGVKYLGQEHAEHLKNALESMYKMNTYWEVKLYIKITLKWNCIKLMVWLSMPGYVESELHEFLHPKPSQPQDSPYPWAAPTYGANSQLAPPPDTTPTLTP